MRVRGRENKEERDRGKDREKRRGKEGGIRVAVVYLRLP